MLLTRKALEDFLADARTRYISGNTAESVLALVNRKVADVTAEIKAATDGAITNRDPQAALEASQVFNELAQGSLDLKAFAHELAFNIADSERQGKANKARISGGPIGLYSPQLDVETRSRELVRVGTELKTLMIGSDPGGGYLAPAERRVDVWPLLNKQCAFLESGVLQMETEHSALELPRVTGAPTVTWLGEGGTQVAGEPTFGLVRANLAKATVAIPYSQELADDTNIAAIIGDLAARAIAWAVDAGAFEGLGAAAQMQGLRDWPGITTTAIAADGLKPVDFDFIADAIGTALANNATGNLVMVMHPAAWKILSKIKTATGSTLPTMMQAAGSISQGLTRSIYGVPVFLCSQLSQTEVCGASGAVTQSVYVYDPNQIAFVKHKAGTTFLTDPFSSASTGVRYLRAYFRAGVAVLNPGAVVRVKGLKLT